MREPMRSRRRFTLASALLIVLVASVGWSPASSDATDAAAPSLPAAAFRDVVVAPTRDRDEAIAPVAQAADFGAIGSILANGGALLGVPQPRRAEPLVRAPVAHSFSGRNHFWIPSLGISDPVRLFECTRKRAPDNYMYRWGCAGANNVYILGHAYGVMKPLHDAFEAGRLRVGMVAIYADGRGRIRAYRVTAWRVVDPVDSQWAIASQSSPSMTLQTCVGKNGVDRLNVRLVEID